jgi:hypothetical protein
MLPLLAGLAWACEADLTTLRISIGAANDAALRADIPCLTEVVSPEDAAAVRRVLGPDGAGDTVAVAPPPRGDVWFDGVISLSRPTARGTLLQQTDRRGAVVLSAWLRPEDPMPPWVTRESRKALSRATPLKIGLLVASGAVTATGVVLAATGSSDCAGGALRACTTRDVGLGMMVGGMVSVAAVGVSINLK